MSSCGLIITVLFIVIKEDDIQLQVDMAVINKYWGYGVPDYSHISSTSAPQPVSVTPPQTRPSFISETAERLTFETDHYCHLFTRLKSSANFFELVMFVCNVVTSVDIESFTVPIFYTNLLSCHLQAIEGKQ